MSGVLAELPFLETEPEAVWLDASVLPLALAACLAAFSARRFCFDAEGAMFESVEERRDRLVFETRAVCVPSAACNFSRARSLPIFLIRSALE